MGALRKVVVFRTLAQEQLENLADALEAGRDEKCRARMGHRIQGDKLWNTHSISGHGEMG